MASTTANIDQKEDNSQISMDKQTLLAVLQFLKKNQLKETEELLKKESGISEDDVKTEPNDSSETQVSQVLAAYKSEGDPSLYEDYYRNLKSFVDRSLDVHKCELAMVLYPVFVHMYLQLVYNNHEETAKDFFCKFSLDQEVYHEEDLKQLATVTKAEHMKGNQLLDNFKGSKFTIKMSRDSYNHLKRHMLEKNQTMLLNIVQEHLFVDVFDGAPRTKQQIDATSGGMGGDTTKQANSKKVLYGLLKEPEINVQLDDDDEDPPADGDKPKKKKAKKDQNAMKKSKNDPNAPSVNRIPLPELKDQDKIEKAKAYRELSKKVMLGPDNLPSICFYTFLNAYQGVTSIDITEDSSMLCAGFADSQIRVFSITANKLRGMKPSHELNLIDREADDVLERIMDDRTATENKLLLGHAGPVYSTSVNPDKSMMVSASEDGIVRLWSLLTWTNLVSYKGHTYPVFDVQFSPHGHYFVTGGYDRTARLWATDMAQPVRIFAGHLAEVDCVQFHPNCNYIATGSTDRTVRLWDVSNGQCVRLMTGHKGAVHSLCFSPCGRYLVSGGVDKTVLMWDLSNGEMVGHLRGHKDTIYSAAFSREGSILATGGLDNTLKVWDVNRLLDDQDTEGTPGLSDSSVYEIGDFPTKCSPVLSTHFTRRNLLLASGPYVPS